MTVNICQFLRSLYHRHLVTPYCKVGLGHLICLNATYRTGKECLLVNVLNVFMCQKTTQTFGFLQKQHFCTFYMQYEELIINHCVHQYFLNIFHIFQLCNDYDNCDHFGHNNHQIKFSYHFISNNIIMKMLHGRAEKGDYWKKKKHET